jgi:ABC-2 type transport system ATP-binding protein
MYSISNFSKSYSGNLIVAIERLRLNPGLYWIKGENGSGKTTLFRSLAGLHPCEGNAGFDDGVSLKATPTAYRKYVNYAEAEPLYPGFLTGKDLVHFVGGAKGMLQEQKQMIERLGLLTYYENSCDTYSSGMLKKLSLGLAFLGKPRVIILDEPLITLDELARTFLVELVHKFLSKQNTIALISSHQHLDESLAIAGTFTVKNKTLLPS